MGSAVLAGHESQMQHFAAGERSPDRQPGATAFFSVYIVLRDGDGFIHRQIGLRDDHPGHQLGQRGYGQNGVIVLAEQHLMRVLVNDKSHAGFEFQRIGDFMQACNLPKRELGRNVGNTGRCFRHPGGNANCLGVGGSLSRSHGTLGLHRADLLFFR
ncbi:hypothetical protein D3C86_1745880 [compost metagenome]